MASPTAVRVDGGMVANDWICQFLADMLNLPVERPKVIETTALGAAYLAGLETGIYDFDGRRHGSLAWSIAASSRRCPKPIAGASMTAGLTPFDSVRSAS